MIKIFNLKWKFIFKLVLIIIGILLLADTVFMAVTVNFNSGVIFSAIMAFVLILYGLFFEKLYNIKWLTCCLSIAFGLLMCMITFIVFYGQIDNITYTEDAAIVLGAGIKGEEVSLLLSYRLDKAVDYYNNNPAAVIIVSGGQGVQETISEALAMERYLIDKGIPEHKIIKEENSTSTYTNFINSKEILDGYFNYDYKIAFITNNYHIYRSTRIAQEIGLDCTHYHAKIQWYAIPVNYLRECVAIFKFWIIGE